MPAPADYLVDFPTLWIVADWIEAHCPIPDGRRKGAPFVMYDWQLWCTVNHYRVRPDAQVGQLGPAFFYRRSQCIAPQKIGKGPWAAAIVCNEGVGPAVFDGFAGDDDGYVCADHGCRCGWEYPYRPGEPMGTQWATPLVQLLATSEDQTDNVYRPLQSMARNGPLADQMRVGEQFIRLPDDGRIDVVTSSATARLGNPLTFALQDETGLYTKTNGMTRVAQTMRRGLAGMGGRSMEHTNAPDPAENSTAQQTLESQRPDIFRFHRVPPAGWSYKNKRERQRIHRYVYAGSDHIDLDAIEGEAAELIETDPAQAERFFGNRLVAGAGSWLRDGLWTDSEKSTYVPDGTAVCAGFDGSDSDDWTALRLETLDGYGFTPTYGPEHRPTIWNPAEWGGRIPRDEVHAAVDEVFARYRVELLYGDPPDWRTELGEWSGLYGVEHVFEWATYRTVLMHSALERTVTDLSTGRLTHDACPLTALAVRNARKNARAGQRYVLAKPAQHQKIDPAMAMVLAHEAASEARVAGWGSEPVGLPDLVFGV